MAMKSSEEKEFIEQLENEINNYSKPDKSERIETLKWVVIELKKYSKTGDQTKNIKKKVVKKVKK